MPLPTARIISLKKCKNSKIKQNINHSEQQTVLNLKKLYKLYNKIIISKSRIFIWTGNITLIVGVTFPSYTVQWMRVKGLTNPVIYQNLWDFIPTLDWPSQPNNDLLCPVCFLTNQVIEQHSTCLSSCTMYKHFGLWLAKLCSNSVLQCPSTSPASLPRKCTWSLETAYTSQHQKPKSC